ncbi:hypothetical protein DASC09_034940 [Saccharomycopsis crataegensis]|uniref:Uncharacterized protein n=1 Tax=Saccharomycopsis crataegensis TaxID=43959 RepID=A0AAV5QNC6_9ASCO|nr:hypothetical protein DASC09_034940 [Saccharomycopsis crataegensis]
MSRFLHVSKANSLSKLLKVDFSGWYQFSNPFLNYVRYVEEGSPDYVSELCITKKTNRIPKSVISAVPN